MSYRNIFFIVYFLVIFVFFSCQKEEETLGISKYTNVILNSTQNDSIKPDYIKIDTISPKIEYVNLGAYHYNFNKYIQGATSIRDTIFQFTDGGLFASFLLNKKFDLINTGILSAYDADYIHCSNINSYIFPNNDVMLYASGKVGFSQIYLYNKQKNEFVLIKKINIPIKGFYPVYIIDFEHNKLYVISYKLNKPEISNNNYMILSQFSYSTKELDNLVKEKDYILPYIPITQDAFFDNGYINLIFGRANTSHGIIKINISTNKAYLFPLDLYMGENEEPEGYFKYLNYEIIATLDCNVYRLSFKNKL